MATIVLIKPAFERSNHVHSAFSARRSSRYTLDHW